MKSNQSVKKEAPDFFKDLQEKFLQELLEMGCEYDDIQDFLEEKGLSELRHEVIIEAMENPQNYKNPLYMKPQEEQHNYDYFNNPADVSKVNQGKFNTGAHMSLPPMGHAVNRLDDSSFNMTDIEESKFCTVCLNNPIDTVLIPCGHRCICSDCSNTYK